MSRPRAPDRSRSGRAGRAGESAGGPEKYTGRSSHALRVSPSHPTHLAGATAARGVQGLPIKKQEVTGIYRCIRQSK